MGLFFLPAPAIKTLGALLMHPPLFDHAIVPDEGQKATFFSPVDLFTPML